MQEQEQGWDHPLQRYLRRSKLCIGYTVEYDGKTRSTSVSVWSHQEGRTNALLGTLTMQNDEWDTLFSHIYQRWENLRPPSNEDEE